MLLCGLLLPIPAAAQPFAYVLGNHAGANDSVAVVDTATLTKVTSIAVGDASSSTTSSIAVGHDGSRVYVVDRAAGSVTVIDTATHSVIGAIPVGLDPTTVVASPDGARLYVGASPPGGQAVVRVVALSTGTVLGSIPLSAPFTLAIALSPDGRRLYANGWTGMSTGYTIKVIDTTIGAVVATIPVAQFPYGLAVSPDGGRVFVSHGTPGTGTLSVIDTAANSLLTTIPVGVNPLGIGFTPDGSRLFVPNSGVPFSISLVNPVTNTVVGSIPGPTHMKDVAFSANGQRAFVPHDAGVAVFDTVSDTAAGNIPLVPAVDGDPRQIVMLPEPPQPPTDLFASIAGNVVTLHWRAALTGAPATSYRFEGGLAPGQSLAVFPTGSALPTYTLNAPSGIFYVRVRAVAGGTTSNASNEIRLVVNAAIPPSAPEGLLGSVNGASLGLAWQPSRAGGVATTHLLDVTGALTTTVSLGAGDTFAFAGVPPGTYTLAVRAANAFGTSGPSNAVTVTFPGPCSGVPASPANVRVYTAGRRVSLFWEPASNGPAPLSYALTVGGAFAGTIPLGGRSLSTVVGPGTYELRLAGVNQCGAGPIAPVQTITVP